MTVDFSSPMTAETEAITRSWITNGLLKRWDMSAQNPRRFRWVSSLGPNLSRRRSASLWVKPSRDVFSVSTASWMVAGHSSTKRRSCSFDTRGADEATEFPAGALLNPIFFMAQPSQGILHSGSHFLHQFQKPELVSGFFTPARSASSGAPARICLASVTPSVAAFSVSLASLFSGDSTTKCNTSE